jgi:hypothetical protein
MVSDGAGGCLFTWTDKRSGNLDVYAQHVHSNGTLALGAPTDGFALCTAPGDQSHAALTDPIIPDGHGGAFLVWSDGRLGPTVKDIYSMHVLATGAPDPLWPVNGLTVCSANRDQGGAELCADGSGGFIAVWTDKRDSLDYDIYAQRVAQNGTLPNVGVRGRQDLPIVQFESPRPNPMVGFARFRYSLAAEALVRLEIVDVAGRRVREWPASTRAAGWNETEWDLRDSNGRSVPNGLYFVRLTLRGHSEVQRVVLAR